MSERAHILSPTQTAEPAADRNILPVRQRLQQQPPIPSLQRITVQPKLSVGAVDDPLEAEADTMADTVMRMPGQNFVQRKCHHCGEDEKVQRQPLTSFIQRKESAAGITAPGAVSDQITASKGGGSNMDSNTRSFMQSRFGTDFGNVKIHTGGEAIQMNRQLNAKAFTVGSDIYFNEGQYQPGSNEGKHLLAHELTHTVQQGGYQAIPKSIQRQTDAGFEAVAGVDTGLTAKTLTKDAAVDGKTFTVNCGFKDYSVAFTFKKAYKGTYPYRASGTDVNGIYVKIEASYTDNQKSGRCTPMRLLQVARSTALNSGGTLESTQPSGAVREQRSGWGNGSAASRGWRADTTETATNAYVTGLSYHANEGSETTPAIIWDSPGQWTTTRNQGAEFYTAAVCEDAAHHKKIVACINWGYYINSSGAIAFRPATPVAICKYSQQLRDASERWDTISGNTATGISF